MSEAILSAVSSAHQPKSLREIFNQFAAETYQRFPELSGRLVFFDVIERRVYGWKAVDSTKTNLTPETVVPFIESHEITQEMEDDPDASSCAFYDPRAKINLIFMNENVSEQDRKAVPLETEQHVLMVLDHELAHCAVRNGRITSGGNQRPTAYDTMIGETVADAYALIRHYQRYGSDSTFGDQYVDPASRAFWFIAYGDKSHFTSFALDELIRRKNEIDFDALTPAQTAELARRFALENMPPKPVMEELEIAFTGVRRQFRFGNVAGGVKALVELTLDPKADYWTFRMGSLWLHKVLESGTLPDGKKLNLPQEFLDDARQRLKVREMQFNEETILLDMPRKPKQGPSPAGLRLAA